MNILSIVGFLSNLFNIGNFFADIWFWILLFLDGLAYTLLAYSFKLFQLMCTLNFNSLYGLISPILTRIKALVMVFVVYKLGISLINFMLNPDEAAKKGKEILINIFITAALLLTYNTIFGVFNELSMLIIGTPENYTFVYLSTIADITDAKDSGLINRLVFGTTEEMPDVGEFIAFSVASTFITDANDPQNTEPLRSAITDPNTGKLNFNMLKELNSDIGKKFDYFYLVGFIAAGFMIFSFVKTTIQIGVRAFKLLILQVIAPIAIITIIGEGTKGKTFKNFVNKYIAVYLEAFIRMFSLLLVCNFVVKFIRNLTDYFPSINTDEWYTYGLMIVLIIIAAFKFATDIPKFIDEILSICDHIVFNSPRQLSLYGKRAKEAGLEVGLRINPECSTQVGHAIYDPCAPGSRLGTRLSEFQQMTSQQLDLLDGLHFHTLCEQNSDDLKTTLDAVEEKFGKYLNRMKWINFGGGHHITREDYDIPCLEQCIRRMQREYGLEVYLEPGEAVALNAGELHCKVLEVQAQGNDGVINVIVDTSAACHMPDVIEMPYTPPIITPQANIVPDGKQIEGAYRLGGPTCLSGDIIGIYQFTDSLHEGDEVVFGDMAIYSMVKTNTFNGMPLPKIYIRRDKNLTLWKQFCYEDFKSRI